MIEPDWEEKYKDIEAELARRQRLLEYVLAVSMDSHRRLVEAQDKIVELERKIISYEENNR